ncbi:MAG: response regulator [Allosphingosinicella sp.]
MNVAGLRVLIVEDEAIIAMTAEDMLEELGCAPTGIAATLPEALEAARDGGFDLALLDINLNGQDSVPVADLLRQKRIPFVFTTGYGSSGRGTEHEDVPLVAKPYRLTELGAAIERALRRETGGG